MNTETIIFKSVDPMNKYAYSTSERWIRALALCAAVLTSAPANAAAEEGEVTNSNGGSSGNSLQILTSAFGLERLKEHTANQNALGVGFARIFGIEASYLDLGESKHATRLVGEDGDEDNVGGRVDLRVAVDVSAPMTRSTRLFSRMGIYYWDLDINYNRVTRELDTSQGGNGQVVSFGAAYDARSVRLSVEIEQLDSKSVIASRDANRVLFNMTSKF